MFKMSVSMGYPSQSKGDIKVLKTGTGTLATGADGQIAVDSFTLPALLPSQRLVIFTEITRTGAENLTTCVSSTSADYSTTAACHFSGNSASMAAKCDVIVNTNPTAATLFDFISPNTIETHMAVGTLGDLSAAHSLYFNINRRAATSFVWRWSVCLIGSDVK